MNKKEVSLWRMCLVLALIAVVAAAGLASVYSVTKAPIEVAKNEKKTTAISKVLPGFKGEFKEVEVREEGKQKPVTVYFAFENDKMFGAAVESYTDKGFNGVFTIMVGFDAEGNILGSEVIDASETPGLGEKISSEKSDFSKQFQGKNPKSYSLKVTKDGGDVDAITAATISSRAYCDAVERAYQSFVKAKEEFNE
ncbi:MAG: RnfABCDGE type electron transport complex subunit G [Bacteroidales bacterium]|nr:RnfABCDGE type electron transport complex subunit G [Bacteroidales bacterium]